ncbi:uncharacterized protein LOC127245797 [Andrographis paniculata]|uniref:uncharacterized protein LOC127245797 n=1 Tax=Andrographis paniculata TaxID=175694 RepID=UPI0021E83B7D|nr:uncharacterized protein LOC127245797 [Andrographis paniculata]
MRTLCRNVDREDALETVLEVPIPEEMFVSDKGSNKSWQNLKAWMAASPQVVERSGAAAAMAEVQLLLGVVGAPLIPSPIKADRTLNESIKGFPIESAMAKYIVQQYIAAAGGEHALDSIDSMYVMGKVRMAASEFVGGADNGVKNSRAAKTKNMKSGAGHVGGFVLWQQRPDLWSLEMILSGCKISAGSNGKVAWRQTPWQNSHASRGPPRPLRRSLQGLDPRLTANLFSNAICIGEKAINGEDCFVLRREVEVLALKARSSNNVEIMKHTIWGSFSQRTGLLVQLEDTHLLRIKTRENVVMWETTMESVIRDYRTINGVNIAHSGRTQVSLFRYGEGSESHTRTRMEEVWSVEEVDFNVRGLSMDFFLPPADLKREDQENHQNENEKSCGVFGEEKMKKNRGLGFRSKVNNGGKGVKIVAVEEDNLG